MLFGIPIEYITAVLGAVGVVFAHRFGIKIPGLDVNTSPEETKDTQNTFDIIKLVNILKEFFKDDEEKVKKIETLLK